MPRGEGIIVGVDMGGTSLRALAADSENRILAVEKVPRWPEQKVGELLGDIVALVEGAGEAAGRKWEEQRAVSIGVPGAVDPERGIVHEAPNLAWRNVALGPRLKELLKVSLLVENDANVGTAGKHILGAGKGAQDLVGVFVGTGVGGGIICRGELHEGGCRGAGEVGHTIFQVDGPRCGCGKRGCGEALASCTAMEREVRAALKAGEKSAIMKITKKRHKKRMTSSAIQASSRNRVRSCASA